MAQGRDRGDEILSAVIYIEGGGDSKYLHMYCRKGFRNLLDKCGFSGRMPRLVACGGRTNTFEDFKSRLKLSSQDDYIAMLIDSEVIVEDTKKTWDHLKRQDGWDKPLGAHDEQALLMVTCMETWIITDRDALCSHYGANLQESALPSLINMETRDRKSVQEALIHATRNCKNVYTKGKQSFEVLAEIKPEALRPYLPGFVRFEMILNEKL